MGGLGNELFEALFALSAEAAIVSRGGVVEDVNQAFERLAGRGSCECRGVEVATLDTGDALLARGVRIPIQVERRTVGDFLLEVLRDLRPARERAELEARMKAIGELATDYHYAADVLADGSMAIRWISDSYTRITGFTVDELREARMGVDFLPPEDLHILLDKSKRARAGEPAVAEYRTRTKSGREIWVRDFTVPVLDERGRVTAIIGAAKDITDEKHAELRLRESEARHRLIAEHSSDVICTIDPKGITTYVSPSVRRVFGYEPEELIGRQGFGLSHPEEAPARRRRYFEVMKEGEPTPLLLTRVRRRDGTYVHIESSTQVVRDAEGRVIEVHSANRDVTQRVEAELALARAEESFREMLATLPDPVLVHREGRVVFVNDAVCKMLGRDADVLLDKSLLPLVYPEDRELVAGLVKSGARFAAVRQLRMLAPDGQGVAVEASGVPVLFDGQLARVVFFRDRREQNRIEEELAVAERLASLGRLASAVGHELNNPLAYVLTSLEILDRDLQGQEELRSRVTVAREGAERMRDIVRDMRSLSVAEEKPTKRGSDLRRVIEVAAATAGHEIRHHARLVIELESTCAVAGVEGRLIQVFVNLLVNAAQAIPEGNVEENEIRISSRTAFPNVVVDVSDTGAGLAAGDAQRIFEPFFTTKASGGTGLGLAIVQRIVASVGGSIAAMPRSPRGTTFRVTLPIASGEPVAKPASAGPPKQVERARVLIADDEPLIGRIVRQLLEAHDVTTVESGRRAIDLLQQGERFDAIVCDLQMTELGGADVYDWVMARRPELERRIAFMTGGAFTPRARSLLDASRRPCLEKPFDARELHELIANLLG
jgi:PAS domain S-box-containing protein